MRVVMVEVRVTFCMVVEHESRERSSAARTAATAVPRSKLWIQLRRTQPQSFLQQVAPGQQGPSHWRASAMTLRFARFAFTSRSKSSSRSAFSSSSASVRRVQERSSKQPGAGAGVG